MGTMYICTKLFSKVFYDIVHANIVMVMTSGDYSCLLGNPNTNNKNIFLYSYHMINYFQVE